MSLSQAYKQVQASVVRVLAFDQNKNLVSSGSGAIVGQGRHVLTCQHCVIQGTTAAIPTGVPNKFMPASTVLWHDATLDLCVLGFDAAIGPPTKVRSPDGIEIGDHVFTVGFPMGISQRSLISGYVSSIESTSLRLDASINQGNSGGPLFNASGEQIGVVNAKHGRLSEMLEHLTQRGPESASITLSGVDPVKVMKQIVVEMSQNLNLGIGYSVRTNSFASRLPKMS